MPSYRTRNVKKRVEPATTCVVRRGPWACVNEKKKKKLATEIRRKTDRTLDRRPSAAVSRVADRLGTCKTLTSRIPSAWFFSGKRVSFTNNIGNAAAPPPPPHDYRTGARDGAAGGRYRFTTFSRAHEGRALSGFPDGGDDGTRRRRTRHFRLK